MRARWMSCDVGEVDGNDGPGGISGSGGNSARKMARLLGTAGAGPSGQAFARSGPVPQREPELLYPDEIASRLGKSTGGTATETAQGAAGTASTC